MAHIDFSNPSNLEHVLSSLGANDTAVIRQAEKQLKPFLKKAVSVLALINQVQNSSIVNVRHMAAIILKKRINVLFSQCSAQDQGNIKVVLLNLLISEPLKVVKTALAGCVACLAKNVLSTGDWPELFALLLQLLQHQEEALRIVCFDLLGQLAENVPAHLKPHTNTVADMVLTGCKDSAHNVTVAAMKAASIYIGSIAEDQEVLIMKKVILPMLDVMRNCLTHGDEDLAAEGLEVFEECISMEQPLINDYVEVLVPFVVSIMKNHEHESALKQAACQTVLSIVEYRPKLLSKKNLVEPVLHSLVEMIASSNSSAAGTLYSYAQDTFDGEEKDDEDYDPEAEQQQLAQMCVDRMAISIPSKYFVQPALAVCSKCLESPEGRVRKAGCAVLGVIAEGCCDSLRQILGDIIPGLLRSIQDHEHSVREAACFALGQFSEHLQPEIFYYHQSVFPVIFRALDDPTPSVQGTTCYCLENFCEGLQPSTLRHVLPELMQRLVVLLQSSSRQTQEMALAAIAACSVSAEMEFLPYAQGIVSILEQVLFVTEEQQAEVRGRALECLGHIAIAVGKENFLPYFEMGLRSAMQGCTLHKEVLLEHTYIYVANTAKIMGDAYTPYLESLVPHLLDCIREPELSPIVDEEDLDVADDDEDDEDDDNFHLNVHSGFVNTKKAALSAIGSLAEHVGAGFYPYLEVTMNTLLEEHVGALWSFHKIVRAEALISLQHLVKVAAISHGITEKPAKGQELQLHNNVIEVCRAAMATYLNAMIEDVERLPASYACEGAGGVIELLGVSALSLSTSDNKIIGNVLMNNIIIMLSEKAKCQTVNQYEADEEEDEEHDNIFIDSVVDLIGTLAKAIGPGFVPYYDQFKSHLLKYTKKNRPYTDRAMAIGCFAEVMAEIDDKACAYVDTLIPILQAGLSDPMEAVRRNSAFCIGVLCQTAAKVMVPNYLQVLQWLYPLCIRPAHQESTDVGGADIDNSLSAVARMINTAPDTIPLAQVLPVMLAALPLRADHLEGAIIYGCFNTLLQAGNPAALALLPQFLNVFAQVLREGDCKELADSKSAIISSLKYLASSQHQSVLRGAIGEVQDATYRAIIEQAINH